MDSNEKCGEKRGMCHVSAGNRDSSEKTGCDCRCGCPVTLPISDEIRNLEEYKKVLQDRIGIVDKKIAGLNSVNTS